MLILVTGPRCSGCSTLSRQILAELPHSARVLLTHDRELAPTRALLAAVDVAVLDFTADVSEVDFSKWLELSAGPALQVSIGLPEVAHKPQAVDGFEHFFVWRSDTSRAVHEVAAAAHEHMDAVQAARWKGEANEYPFRVPKARKPRKKAAEPDLPAPSAELDGLLERVRLGGAEEAAYAEKMGKLLAGPAPKLKRAVDAAQRGKKAGGA